MLELLALQLARRTHPEVGEAVADVSHLPFVDGSFDATLCVTVLCDELVPDPAATVRELGVSHPRGWPRLPDGARRPPPLAELDDRVTHSARRFSRRDLSALVSSERPRQPVRSTAALRVPRCRPRP